MPAIGKFSPAVINGARCRISHSTNAQDSQEWIALGGIEKEDDKQPNILARGNPRGLGETSKTALGQPHARPRPCLADSARAGRTMRLAAEQPKIAHIRILARPEQDSRPLDRRDSGQWRCGGQARRRWAPITQIKRLVEPAEPARSRRLGGNICTMCSLLQRNVAFDKPSQSSWESLISHGIRELDDKAGVPYTSPWWRSAHPRGKPRRH